jgi:hypothetical protein
VECGVPQGSVLGPILWITTYDSVLQCPMSPGTDMVCNADDTLVLAGVADGARHRGSRRQPWHA